MKPIIQVQNLTLKKRKRGREFTLLDDISLQIETDRVTLFLGKSGSGKTSVLRCLSQIESRYHGQIAYNGKRLDQLSQKQRCQLIGFVPQAYALFPSMTVLENCAHPLQVVLGLSKRDSFERVESRVATLGMQSLLHHYPHELSGGQQQRTAILRALLLDPVFLLLDEPTSALDPENTELLIEIIDRLKAEGKGVVISSQDMYFAQKIHERVYFLEHGSIIEDHDLTTSPESLDGDSKLGKFLNTKKTPSEVYATV